MIEAYTTIQTMAQALRDSTTLEDYVVGRYNKGLLVQVNDNPANPIGADQTPFCVLYRVPQSLLGTIAENDQFALLIVVGVVEDLSGTQEGVPYTITTARTATDNGLAKWSNPENAEALLVRVVNILKGVNLGDIMIAEVDSDVDGASELPLQTATASLLVQQKRTLSDW